MKRVAILTAAALLLALVLASPAQGTFPGRNGRIALELSSTTPASEWLGYIVTINADGSDPRKLAGWTAQDPAYSADGETIAFARYGQVDTLPIWVEDEHFVKVFRGIFLMRSDGSGKRRLIAGPYRDPDWSPDGSRLVVTRTQKPRGILIWRRGRLRRLVSGASPAWSPMGRLIALTRRDGIYVVRPDGTGMRRLVAGRRAKNPEWSPDGRHVLFARGVNSMYSIRPSGTGLRRVSSVDGRYPVYSPDATLISYAQVAYFKDSILTMRENGEERTGIFTLVAGDEQLERALGGWGLEYLDVVGLNWQPLLL